MLLTKLHIKILCLLPHIFPGILGESLSGKALNNNIWSYEAINIRDFGIGKHKQVDDAPYGGGNGMVIRADVLGKAIDSNINGIKSIYSFSPKGTQIDAQLLKKIINDKTIMLICGKFEGIDHRLSQEYNIHEISMGDIILSCGEVCALMLIDACVRLLPGVLGNSMSHVDESFSEDSELKGILEYPIYTRPRVWKGNSVPDVLLSGNHGVIKKWRMQQAIEITSKKRPDLIKKYNESYE